MANCIICKTELKFLNTPMFGSGKTKDGMRLCAKCYQDTLIKRPLISTSKNSSEDYLNLIGFSKIEAIKKQIGNIDKKLLDRHESTELAYNTIEDGEIIENIFIGGFQKDKTVLNNGFIVITNKKLIVVNSNLTGTSVKTQEFHLDKITSIFSEKSSFSSNISITHRACLVFVLI